MSFFPLDVLDGILDLIESVSNIKTWKSFNSDFYVSKIMHLLARNLSHKPNN